jgi:PKD repeat protein
MCDRAATVAALALLGVLSASCEKAPLYAPTGTTIRLTANAQELAINGSAQITASVLESGGYAVQNGTRVSFTTTLGTISPSEVATANGQAVTTFYAGTQTGTAVINAFSGANSTSGSAPAGGGTTTATGSGVSILIGSVPTVTITGPTTTPTAGLPSTFTLAVAPGKGSALVQSVIVDFGDGTSVDLGAATGTISVPHTYAKPGTYSVAATAIDSAGQRGSMSLPVIVFASVPFTLTVTGPSGRVGTPISVTAVPAPGSPAIVSYRWDFGDGTSVTTTVGAVSHIYTSIPVGYTSYPYVVTVTALGVDGRGGVGSTSVLISQ